MKRLFILLLSFVLTSVAMDAEIIVRYTYDEAGNRTSVTIEDTDTATTDAQSEDNTQNTAV